MKTPVLIHAIALCVLAAVVSPASAADRVTILRTTGAGIQPQAVIDAKGVIHLIDFRGKPAAGDLFYSRWGPRAGAGAGFSPSIQVNSQPGSAIALGTIRGGQIALGKGGRVHVAWNGSGTARPRNSFGGSPMLYARSDPDGQAFEPQRNLMTRTSVLDGGGTVAADGAGNVYVAWHGKSTDAPEGEQGRRMWMARSADDGATFAPEVAMIERATGACGCCGTRAMADRRGGVYALFRAATDGVERGIYLLASSDKGDHFRVATTHAWQAKTCPMSSASLAEGPGGVVASWETNGQVYLARLDQGAAKASPPISPPGGKGDRKHPAVAIDLNGETILVWAEGTGWQKGGSLAWQVFDTAGQPTGEKGRIEGGVPIWGLPTVVARPEGGFTIIR
jgi:hypothetical protein